jgi:hypothetical protein
LPISVSLLWILYVPPAEILHAENQALKAELAQRDALIAWLQKQVFGGGKSEKLDAA